MKNMTNSIQSIALDKLEFHPDNPNKQSKVNFAKLVRNIERTGRYEPLIVRPSPNNEGCFQILNGHQRLSALARLGYEKADCIIWDVNDEETDILLTTLNRLGGTDELDKKLKLLKRLNKRIATAELAKLLPQTAKQIERLTHLRKPIAPATINANSFVNPLVFFVNDTQQRQIEKALSLVEEPKAKGPPNAKECVQGIPKMTKAARRAMALTHIAGYFINSKILNLGVSHNGQKKKTDQKAACSNR